MITRLAELNPPFTALEPRQPSPLGLRQSLRSRKKLKSWPVNHFSIAMTSGDFTAVNDDLIMDSIGIIALSCSSTTYGLTRSRPDPRSKRPLQ